MASLAVLESIAILVGSIGIGFLYFYLLSPEQGKVKRQQINDAVSMIINFIIYIWIGKIIANISTFISDPIAVLAYPSNAKAVYFATGLFIINVMYKKRREKILVIDSLPLYLPVFLAATFTFEVIQWTINGQRYNGLMLLFITIILLIFTLKRKVTMNFIVTLTLIVCLGLFVITLVSTLMTLFGYILTPLYFIILSLVLFSVIYREKRMVEL